MIIGHEHTISFLKKILERGSAPHAMLFCGPESVGKRTVAVFFARGILCRERKFGGCGVCASCSEWAQLGASRDFLNVAPDEKNNISIDTARSVAAFLSRTPALGFAKAVLIDDAEQLTEEAENALLKTLEEPPGNSVLVFITAKPGRLFQTVRSRLVTIRFSFVPEEKMAVFPPEIRSIATGRPGAAFRFTKDRDAFIRARALIKKAELALSGDAADKIIFADEITKDSTDLLFCISYWIESFCRKLHETSDPRRLQTIGRNARLALAVAFTLEDTELAPKLLVENMLLAFQPV